MCWCEFAWFRRFYVGSCGVCVVWGGVYVCFVVWTSARFWVWLWVDCVVWCFLCAVLPVVVSVFAVC